MAEQGKIADLFDAFDRLSTREKLMVSGLGGALTITVLVVVWLMVGNQITQLEMRNQQTRETLSLVMAQKDSFLAQKRRLAASAGLLDQNEIKLVKLMETKANELGISIEEFKEGGGALTENARKAKKRGSKKKVKDLFEETQTITIRRISLDQLAHFISALEKRPEPIKVTKLSIHTLASDRQVLREIRMTVATYRNKEVDPS